MKGLLFVILTRPSLHSLTAGRGWNFSAGHGHNELQVEAVAVQHGIPVAGRIVPSDSSDDEAEVAATERPSEPVVTLGQDSANVMKVVGDAYRGLGRREATVPSLDGEILGSVGTERQPTRRKASGVVREAAPIAPAAPTKPRTQKHSKPEW